MCRYSKIEDRLLVGGQPVEEYDNSSNSSHASFDLTDVQIHKSIESIPNANYEIEVITHPGFNFPENHSWDVLSFTIEIDGVWMCKPLNHSTYYKEEGQYREVIKGLETCVNGAHSVREFKFKVCKGEGEHNTRNGDLLQPSQPGIVKIEVRREKYIDVSGSGTIAERKTVNHSLSETQPKGHNTITSLGVSQHDGNALVVNTKKYDAKPKVTFNFHYASPDVLGVHAALRQSITPASEDAATSDTLHAELLEESCGPKIKIEANENVNELQRRQAQRARTLEQLERSTGSKRSRSPSPLFFDSNDDDEIQEIKRPRLGAEVEVIVVDD